MTKEETPMEHSEIEELIQDAERWTNILSSTGHKLLRALKETKTRANKEFLRAEKESGRADLAEKLASERLTIVEDAIALCEKYKTNAEKTSEKKPKCPQCNDSGQIIPPDSGDEWTSCSCKEHTRIE